MRTEYDQAPSDMEGLNKKEKIKDKEPMDTEVEVKESLGQGKW